MAEKEYWQYSLSVSKALNSSEAPLKTKHARYIIITTHHHKECNTLWKLLSSQPIMENRFTAWKFCHLLHKVFREGHSSSLEQSQSHKKMLLEMGKLWGHLDDLGICIRSYSNLLVRKLDFHLKNSFIPGSFAISIEDFEKHCGNDINVYFQLCVEMFDYMEDILNLQSCVFHSVNTYRMFSMSLSAQCRLSPLITLIQDSNPLYDFCVRVMFKLHDNLQSDLLNGHRCRFKDMFSKLKLFYDKVRPLQYFEDLIQVPNLPEQSPNFTSKVDFGNYIPPVVKVPDTDSKPDLANLVDLSLPSGFENPLENEEYKELLHTKNLEIIKMEHDIFTLRDDKNNMKEKFELEINELTGKLNTLRNELINSKELCTKMHKQLSDTPDLIQRNIALEDKAKALEENFNKFRTMYLQIREEHICLLRQNGETNKLLSSERKLTQDLKYENESLKDQVKDLLSKVKSYDNDNKHLQKVLESLSSDTDRNEKEHIALQSQVEYFKNLEESYKKEIESTKNMLVEKADQLNKVSEQLILFENGLSDVKKEADQEKNKYEDMVDRINFELQQKILEVNQLKEAHKLKLYEDNLKYLEIQKKVEDMNQSLCKKEIECKQIFEISEEQKRNSLKEIDVLQCKCEKAIRDMDGTIAEKNLLENQYKKYIEFLFKSLVSAAQTTFITAQQSTKSSIDIIEELLRNLDLLHDTHNTNYMEEKSIDSFVQSMLATLNFLTMLHGVSRYMYTTSADIKEGEKLLEKMLSLKTPINKMFSGIKCKDECILIESSNELNQKLHELKDILQDMDKTLKSSLDLADRMKFELADMEKAIVEATERFVEMLTHTKSNDDGIKLKVNEKILDACTNLMESIKILIKMSTALQDEIVLSGRGNVSIQEFYKRNSEWTEGLISAAKSIAKGANFLVDAANNAVVKESVNNMEIVVAAQEIAACTAQLVVASKVKAPKNSKYLQELTAASRSVSHATGVVVAIVKDCVEQVERHSEIDFLKLTSSQAKATEMNIQLKVLELEQALNMERQRLASFRKNLYKNCEN